MKQLLASLIALSLVACDEPSHGPVKLEGDNNTQIVIDPSGTKIISFPDGRNICLSRYGNPINCQGH